MKKVPTTLFNYLKEAKVRIPKGMPDLRMPFTPKPHQVSGLNQCLANDRWGLFDQQGTGKTVIMQAYSLVHKWNGYKTLLIMPPILLEQFQESLMDTFHGVGYYVTMHTLEDSPKRRKELYKEWDEKGWPDLMLTSYQMFNKEETIEKVCPHYNIFVADEAQFLRGHDSNTHGKLYELTEDHKEFSLLLATGTPVHTTPEDAFGIIRLLNRNAYSSYKNFKSLHLITKMVRITLKRPVHGRKFTMSSQVVGFRGMDFLKHNLYLNARRALRKDVLPIGEPTMVEVPINLHPDHLRLYRAFKTQKILELDDDTLIVAETAQALRQELLRMVSVPHMYGDKVSITKNRIFEAVQSIMDSDPEAKLTVFANLQVTVEALAERFKDYNPALAYGGTGGSKQNRKQVNKFKTDDTCRMFIANPKSAGAGLNLQDVCYRAVFVEPITIPGDFKQACDRFTREGQLHPVVIYVLIPRQTIAQFHTETMREREGYFIQLNPDKTSFIMEAEGRFIKDIA